MHALGQQPDIGTKDFCVWCVFVADENIAVAKPFVYVIDKAFAAYPSNSEIKSKCMFLKALLA